MLRRSVLVLSIAVFLLEMAGPAGGATYYVDQNGFADFNSIQAAISDPCTVDGDEIEVAPGTYYEAIDFDGKGVRLYSSGGRAVTTIDANGAYHAVKCVSGEDANTILEGFTITGGNASGSGSPNSDGGGMLNDDSSPTVNDCKFVGNAAYYGGGMYNGYGSNPSVTNCIFNNNAATYGGAGMFNKESIPSMTNCEFLSNEADWGGGMSNYYSSPTVTNCNFTGNSAPFGLGGGGMGNTNSSPTVTNCNFTGNSSWGGGGMGNMDNSNPIVTNCTFSSNHANNTGGGMHNDLSSSPIISNCSFTANSANGMGGGIGSSNNCSGTVTDCTFSGNTAGDSGGGMFNVTDCSWTLTNCTFANNSALRGGGMLNDDSSPTVNDCVFTGNTADNYGGGMSNNSSSPTVTNCTFSDNHANNTGGGMHNDLSSSPIISNCSFTANSANGMGGGIGSSNNCSGTVTDCTFSGNTAGDSGGGMFNVTDCSWTLTNCTFTGNTATGYGGGMLNSDSSPTVTDCVFTGNTADSYGGGMSNNSSSPTVTNCTFSGNDANSTGGGMHNDLSSPIISNCRFTANSAEGMGGGIGSSKCTGNVANSTFNENTAGDSGGGMFNVADCSWTITNCTFTRNTANNGGAMHNYESETILTNCILWGDSPHEISWSATVTYSDVEGGWSGTGNINADPCFIDANAGDLRLRPNSPCIDAGNNTAVPASVLKDLAGKLRFADDPCTPDIGYANTNNGRPVVDMGAYEYQGCGAIPQNLLANPGFETGDATGWMANWGLEADTNHVHDGNYSGLASGRTATWDGAWQSVLGLMDDGKTYRISGWVMLENADSNYVQLTVKKTDLGGTNFYPIDNATGFDDQWVHLDGTLALDVNGQPTELYVYFEGPAADVNFFVDDASVTEVKGDMNHNGGVDFIDFSLFASYYGFDCSTQDCGRANLYDCDNAINERDLAILVRDWLVGK